MHSHNLRDYYIDHPEKKEKEDGHGKAKGWVDPSQEENKGDA